MTSIIVLFGVLVGPYAVTRLRRRGQPPSSSAFAGRAGLALLFALTGLGHFAQTDAMARMLPPFVPAREALVIASGVFEVALAGALLTRRWSPAGPR